MDAFDYSAMDAGGVKRSGTLMAGSAREARDLLRARSLTPLDLNRSRKKAIKAGDLSETKTFSAGKIKHAELTRATRQLAILIDAATPVEDALRVTALQFEKSQMKNVLLSIRLFLIYIRPWSPQGKPPGSYRLCCCVSPMI